MELLALKDYCLPLISMQSHPLSETPSNGPTTPPPNRTHLSYQRVLTPSVLATNLIKPYSERCLIKEARILFDEMPERDVVAWTAMIAGYTSCNHYNHAWAMFCEMVRNGVEPNAFTLSSALKGCKSMKALSYGALVHGLAIKHGMKESMYVNKALMDMYATCCVSMDEACMVFQKIDTKNAVSWTTLITGYTHRGDGYVGLRVFRQMLLISS